MSGSAARAVVAACCVAPLFVSPPAMAQAGRVGQVVCAEIAPYCFVENAEKKGYVYEIGREILRRLGQADRIEFQPLARSIHSVQNGERTISLWLGRIPQRENTVHWIAPIVTDAFHIYTLKNGPDAVTLEKARALGVLAATIAGSNIVAARDLGLERIDSTASEDANGKKLLSGRVDGWISSGAVVGNFVFRHHLDPERIVRGVKITDYTAFIVASPDVDGKTQAEWKRIHEALVREGFVAKAQKKYGVPEK